MKILKILTTIITSVLVIPLFIEFFIIENTFPSNATNDGWLGFLGGYLGAIIGALITLFVLYHTLKLQQKHFDENKQTVIRPFFTLKSCSINLKIKPRYNCSIKFALNSTDINSKRKLHLYLVLRNIGVGNCVKWDIISDDSEYKGIKPTNIGFSEHMTNSPTNKYCLIGEEILIEVEIDNCIDSEDGEYYLNFEFFDMLKNRYRQRFRLLTLDNNVLVIDIGEPILQ